MRLRNKPWAKEKLQQHPHVVIPNPETYRGKWRASLREQASLYIEIGTGKGRFITESAKQHPDVLYIGIEKMKSVIVSALDKVLEADVANVKLLNMDARDLAGVFAEGEVDRIFLNFSDPWPKARHEKRRLTYRRFLALYENILKPGGEIHLKTDNRDFFEYSVESFQAYGLTVKHVNRNVHESGMEGNVMTEYEQKFFAKGKPIFRCEAKFDLA